MVKTRLQALRSLESAHKTLKKALRKSVVADRKTKRGNISIQKKARKELKSLEKNMSKLKKALGKGPKRKRKTNRRRKRKTVRKRRKTRRRRR